jgi:hypothetical protein
MMTTARSDDVSEICVPLLSGFDTVEETVVVVMVFMVPLS